MNEDACWQAVCSRDTSTDTVFVYAVRTTGIYCRPSCPARKPRRERVCFFATPAEAEQAGFRPCQRCLPQHDQAATPHPQAHLVQRICQVLETRIDQPPTLEALGAEFSLSPHHLQRVFKRVMGMSPRQYVEACRMQALKARLREGATVTEALYEAGYQSSSRLYEHAAGHMGMTPGQYRQRGAGMHITYTIVDSPLDRLLVAATEQGICAVYLGDNDDELQAALALEYPQATRYPDDTDLLPWVEALLRHLDGQQPHLALPLDVQATAFQWQVWQALRAIPYGSTRTYGELAAEIGKPGAARAVGRACATNPVSLVVPCHRAVREDGTPGGYRWGVERKHALLAHEAQHST